MLHFEGSSLLEVMVSMILLAILLLGMDAMQWLVAQQTKSIYYFAAADQQLNILLERAAHQLEIDDHSFAAWNTQNQRVLPSGNGKFNVNNEGPILSLFWGKQSGPEQTCERSVIGTTGCLYAPW